MPRPKRDTPVRFSQTKNGKRYWSARFRGVIVSLGPDGDPATEAAWKNFQHRVIDSPDAVSFKSTALLLPELFARYWNAPECPRGRDATEKYKRVAVLLFACSPEEYPGGPDYSELEADQLTPTMFKAWRNWITALEYRGRQRYASSTIKKLSYKLVEIYTWGVTEGLVTATVTQGLRDVLRVRVVGARSGQRRLPAVPADVEATLPHLPPSVRAAVQLQRLTGARPSELLPITPGAVIRSGVVDVPGFGRCDLDAAGLWVMPLSQHKTMGKGKNRAIWFTREAQAILAPWLNGEPDQCCFAPRVDREIRLAELRAKRKTKVQPSQANRGKARPKWRAGETWSSVSYLNAVKRGCEKAGVPVWTPYQLRHLAKDEITRRHGIEVAQVILGHESVDMTTHYGGRDFELVKRFAASCE